jgi:hypothetical protein
MPTPWRLTLPELLRPPQQQPPVPPASPARHLNSSPLTPTPCPPPPPARIHVGTDTRPLRAVR